MLEFLRENASVIFLSTLGGVAGLCYAQQYYPKQSVFLVDELASRVYSTVKPYIPAGIVDKLPLEALSPPETQGDGLLKSTVASPVENLLDRVCGMVGFQESIFAKITKVLHRNKVEITCSITGFTLVYCILRRFTCRTQLRRSSQSPSDPFTLLMRYLQHLFTRTCSIMSNNELETLLLGLTLLFMILHLNPDIRFEIMGQKRCLAL